MIIQNNNFNINEDSNFLFDKNINFNISVNEDNYILDNHIFIFNDEKNSKIKKQITKRLGERSNLWTK